MIYQKIFSKEENGIEEQKALQDAKIHNLENSLQEAYARIRDLENANK